MFYHNRRPGKPKTRLAGPLIKLRAACLEAEAAHGWKRFFAVLGKLLSFLSGKK
jgi:hypothetical protein